MAETRELPAKYNLPPYPVTDTSDCKDNYEISSRIGQAMRAYRDSLTPEQLESYNRYKSDEYVRSLFPYNKEGFIFAEWRDNLIQALIQYDG